LRRCSNTTPIRPTTRNPRVGASATRPSNRILKLNRNAGSHRCLTGKRPSEKTIA
jgi:hypothetical protein